MLTYLFALTTFCSGIYCYYNKEYVLKTYAFPTFSMCINVYRHFSSNDNLLCKNWDIVSFQSLKNNITTEFIFRKKVYKICTKKAPIMPIYSDTEMIDQGTLGNSADNVLSANLLDSSQQNIATVTKILSEFSGPMGNFYFPKYPQRPVDIFQNKNFEYLEWIDYLGNTHLVKKNDTIKLNN